jgi:hypothetical protein
MTSYLYDPSWGFSRLPRVKIQYTFMLSEVVVENHPHLFYSSVYTVQPAISRYLVSESHKRRELLRPGVDMSTLKSLIDRGNTF